MSNILGVHSKLASNEGFQNYVSQEDKLTPVNGAPSAGQFRSDITNRASIPDLSKGLKPTMGIERIQTQEIFKIQDEFGANGEQVFGIVNDSQNSMRLVGGAWDGRQNASGPHLYTDNTNDYIEIVFYGTGLNMLAKMRPESRDWQASIDGGAEFQVYVVSSDALIDRGYAPNIVSNVVSGLSLGIHTVKIRNAHAIDYMSINGFEILNESSQIKINEGAAFIDGQKAVSTSQDSFAYNSGFDSASDTLGTRGGCVLMYMDAAGNKKKRLKATNASQLNLTLADHSNEEIIRTYNWREFGANRSDDFSTLAGTQSNRAFTLDDGTTTLVGEGIIKHATSSSDSWAFNTSNVGSVFTFVGTGCDVTLGDHLFAVSDPTQVWVDGVNVGNLNDGDASFITIKLVSGLPYGTHTVKLFRTTTNTGSPTFNDFIVYGPKKPELPENCIELGSYYLMGDFVANTTLGKISQGGLYKDGLREVIYGGSGAWSVLYSPSTVKFGGQQVHNANAGGQWWEYTFFGTGISRFGYGDSSCIEEVTVDGVVLTNTNFPSVTVTPKSDMAYTASTGRFSPITGGSYGNGWTIEGLPLGVHTVRGTSFAGGAAWLAVSALEIITPIHSPKSNLPASFQNTLPVGSLSLGDSRVFSPLSLSDGLPNYGVAKGVASSPSTSSTSPVPNPDMVLIIKTNGNPIEFDFHDVPYVTVGAYVYFKLYMDGEDTGHGSAYNSNGNSYPEGMAFSGILPASAGVHILQIKFYVSGGTGASYQTWRHLSVKEMNG